MDEKLTLNNGEEVQGHLLETDTRLFLYLYEISLADAFALLIEPENTKIIKWERYGTKGTVRGYKHLVSISEESGGMISASLKK